MAVKDKLILNCSEYSVFKMEYGLNNPNPRVENFHGEIGWYPFCLKNTVKIYNKSNSFIYDFGAWREMYETVWQCDYGWWQVDFYIYMEEENIYKEVHSCRLEKFTIKDKNIPIQTLRLYLEKNQNI